MSLSLRRVFLPFVSKLSGWFKKPWLRLGISLCLVAALLAVVPFSIDEVLTALARTQPGYLLLALVVKVAPVYFSARRQLVLFRTQGIQMSHWGLFRVLMLGEALNRFTPGSLGAMAYLLLHAGGHKRVLGLILIDKLWYLACVTGVAGVASYRLGFVWLGLLLLASTAACTLVPVLAHRLLPEHELYAEARGWLSALGQKLSRQPLSILDYLGSVLLGIGCAVVGFYLVLRAVGVRVGLDVAVSCVTLSTVAAAVPLTLSGLGLREWVLLTFLRGEFSASGFVGYLLIVYLISLANSLLGAILSLVLPARRGSVG